MYTLENRDRVLGFEHFRGTKVLNGVEWNWIELNWMEWNDFRIKFNITHFCWQFFFSLKSTFTHKSSATTHFKSLSWTKSNFYVFFLYKKRFQGKNKIQCRQPVLSSGVRYKFNQIYGSLLTFSFILHSCNFFSRSYILLFTSMIYWQTVRQSIFFLAYFFHHHHTTITKVLTGLPPPVAYNIFLILIPSDRSFI